MFENFGFLKSMFSILTRGKYRKDGFIKVGEKNPRHPRFRSGREFYLKQVTESLKIKKVETFSYLFLGLTNHLVL